MKHVEFIENRLGQDYRYSISSEKIRKELNWKPKNNTLFNFIGDANASVQ
jgi:dTDP-D-glucose 4,6-dehydratase